jgi:DNA (cytosine-5)-methyltransferase 1
MSATKTGASMDRAHSRQDYATPREFLAAVEKRWGAMEFDLAADAHNSVCGSYYYGPGEDSLAESWALSGNLWLNPPFSDISPWAKKCSETALKLGRIFLLVPASIGSNWFAKYVHPYAFIYALQGRLSFDGKAPYPKDCMLCVYGMDDVGFTIWDWRRPS